MEMSPYRIVHNIFLHTYCYILNYLRVAITNVTDGRIAFSNSARSNDVKRALIFNIGILQL